MKVASDSTVLQPVQPRLAARGTPCFGGGPLGGQFRQSAAGEYFGSFFQYPICSNAPSSAMASTGLTWALGRAGGATGPGPPQGEPQPPHGEPQPVSHPQSPWPRLEPLKRSKI